MIVTVAITMAVGMAIAPLFATDPEDVSKATIEDFSFPTTQEGRAIQVIFGSPRMQGYNDLWHDLTNTSKIRVSYKVGFNTKHQTVGYKYYMGLHYGWCAYAEELLELRMAEEVIFEKYELGDDRISNGDFDDGDDDWTLSGGNYVSNGRAYLVDGGTTSQSALLSGTYTYKVVIKVTSLSGTLSFTLGSITSDSITNTGTNVVYAQGNGESFSVSVDGVGDTASITEIEVYIVTAENDVTSNGTITINKSNLFGGEDSQGGVSGDIDVMFGESDQAVNTYLYNRLANGGSTPVPAYRGMVSTVANGLYIGTQTQLKAMDAVWKRTTKTNRGEDIWYPEKAEITDEGVSNMNIAHIVREIITDQDYSLGFTTSVDDTSFQLAASTLYDEGFGLSFVLDSPKNGSRIISRLMEICNGFARVNIETNQFELKLMRNDFEIDDLDIVDESIISEVTKISRDNSTEIYNQVTVVYTDPDDRTDKSIIAQNTGLISAYGVVVDKKIDVPYCHSPTLANKIATMTLRGIATNPFTADIKGNRNLIKYNLGDAFRIQMPDEDLSDVVVRVVEIDHGSLLNGEVTMKISQDIYKAESAIFSNADSSAWSSSLEEPTNLDDRLVIELPYYNLARDILGESSASLLDTTTGRAAVVGAKNASNNTSLGVYEKLSTDTDYSEVASEIGFAAYAELDEGIAQGIAQLTINYTNGIDVGEVEVGIDSYCQINSEIFKLISVDATNETITIERGCLDTVPVSHTIGDKIFFVSDSYATTSEYSDGQTVDIKIVPSTTLGELDIGDATSESLTVNKRYIRPYNAGNFAGAVNVESIDLTWAHRNRLSQVQEIVTQSQTGITPEDGTEYTLTILDNGVQVAQITGLTGESYSYLIDDRASDFDLIGTGTASPDLTGTYSENGTQGGEPKYDNGSTALWHDSGLWYLTAIAEVGTVPTDNAFSNTSRTGAFSPVGTSTGSIDVTVNDSLASYKLKSTRDGHDSWQEWHVGGSWIS